MTRVVVTGLGVVSCLGDDLDTVSRALQEGRSGVVFSEDRIAKGFRSGLKTRLPEINFKTELDRKARKYMPEQAQYCAVATNRALLGSGLSREDCARDDVGIIIGNDSSSGPLPELMETLDKYGESHFLGSSMVIKVMNSTVSMNLGPYLGARGINLTLSAACSSGAHSMGLAYSLIRSGAQRMIFAGGAQEVNWLSMVSFDAMKSFSVRHDEPQKASRPFDMDRDGLIPGGGGAMVILESLESAKARDARIYGEVIGYGFSSDGDHLTTPSGDGALRCMKSALESSGVRAGEVDYINAHATSTPVGDQREAGAIHEIFGSNGPAVSSTKSMTGHECWMAGASEVVYSMLMMRDGFLAPNINFGGFDDQTPEINLVTETQRGEPKVILSNSFGFGGTNASLVLRSFDQ
jgi:3-oxoacyl-[acyl-carrier-protein] synthase-1